MSIFGMVTSKGQATIPEEVRDQLGLAEGSRIEWRVSGSGQATVVAPKRKLEDLFGMLGKAPEGEAKPLTEVDQDVRQAVARHALGKGQEDAG